MLLHHQTLVGYEYILYINYYYAAINVYIVILYYIGKFRSNLVMAPHTQLIVDEESRQHLNHDWR